MSYAYQPAEQRCLSLFWVGTLREPRKSCGHEAKVTPDLGTGVLSLDHYPNWQKDVSWALAILVVSRGTLKGNTAASLPAATITVQ